MKRLLFFSLMVTSILLSASFSLVVASTPDDNRPRSVQAKGSEVRERRQHPRLVETRSLKEYNYEMREYEVHFEVDYVAGLDRGGNPVVGTTTFSSYEYPYDVWEVDWARTGRLSRRLIGRRQKRVFENYTLAVIKCEWNDAEAYDNARTWNPNSSLHISDYAYEAWGFMRDYVRNEDCNGGSQEPPRPVGVAAPTLDDVSYWPSTFVTVVTLANGTEADCRFDLVGGSWVEDCSFEPAPPEGYEADILSQYVSYTFETLSSCENRFRFDSLHSWQMRELGEGLLSNYCISPSAFVCEETAVPHIDDMEPDSSSFFYVTIQFEDGIGEFITQGYEHDGDQWQMAEQYGDVPGATCQAQLNTFTDYTMDILTASTCTAVPIYTPEEESQIAWYVQEVQTFCQTNQHAPQIVGVDWHAPTLFIVDTQLENGQTVGIELEEHYLDPDPWWGFGQYFEPEDVIGAEAQAELFVNYTLETLNTCENAFDYPYSYPSFDDFINELMINFCTEGGA